MFVETRAAFRLARVGLHLLWGAATVRVVYPWIDARFRRALKRRWSRQLLEALGIRLKVGARGTAWPGHFSDVGTALPERGLVVCNHISWLDIYVINALTPAAFVSKDDVKHWPLIGWLCAHTETIFLARGSRAAAQRTRETMIGHLQAGVHVAVFPEGTTTGGDRVLPFHAALLQSAIDAETPIIPLALRYTDRHGNPSRAPAYDGDITLWQCLRAIARAGGLTADLRVLEAIDTASCNRRELSLHCRETIAWHLGQRNFLPQTDADVEAQKALLSAEFSSNAGRAVPDSAHRRSPPIRHRQASLRAGSRPAPLSRRRPRAVARRPPAARGSQ
jgi:1-acyl-sn-glycerol-3-phosphate acyltransferase